MAAHLGETLNAITGSADVILFGGQELAEHFDGSRVVINDQQIGAQRLLAPGQDENEFAASAWFALDPNVAAVQLDQLAAKIKTQPHPLFSRGVAGLDLIKAIKNVLLLFLGNAATGVGDGDLEQFGPARSLADFHHDAAAGRGVLDGVGQEVGDDLGHAPFVQRGFRQVRLDVLAEADVFGGRPGSHGGHDALGQSGQGSGF